MTMMNRNQRNANRRTNIRMRDQVLLDRTADELADIAASMRTGTVGRAGAAPGAAIRSVDDRRQPETEEKGATGLCSSPKAIG